MLLACSEKQNFMDKVAYFENDKSPQMENTDLHLDKVLDIDLTKLDILSDVRCIKMDKNSDLYVLTSSNKIAKMNKAGDELFRLDKKGNGPGEFAGEIYSFDVYRDTLYVPDSNKRAISIYSGNGSYITQIKFDEVYSPTDILKTDMGFTGFVYKMMMSQNGIEKSTELNLYNNSMVLIKNIAKATHNQSLSDKYNPFKGGLCYRMDRRMTVATEYNSKEFKFDIYSVDGSKISETSRHYDKVSMDAEGNKKIDELYNFSFNGKKLKLNVDYRNTIEEILIDNQNNIWIKSNKKYDVFKDNKYYCRLTLDQNTDSIFFSGDLLFTVKESIIKGFKYSY